jgi:transposase
MIFTKPAISSPREILDEAFDATNGPQKSSSVAFEMTGTADAPQRWHDVRDVYNALRWIVAGCFEDMVYDLRALLREAMGREPDSTAVILDARTLRGTPESGHRAGYDDPKKTRSSKVHTAVDTLGHLLALRVTPARTNDRAPVADLTSAVPVEMGHTVEVAFVDDGYTGPKPATAAREHGIELVAITLPEAKRGFVLLPRRWVAERSVGWAARFRRLARDSERLPETVAGLHFVAFAWLMTHQLVTAIAQSPSQALDSADPVALFWIPRILTNSVRTQITRSTEDLNHDGAASTDSSLPL